VIGYFENSPEYNHQNLNVLIKLPSIARELIPALLMAGTFL
jgi:hypothetical protein